MWELSQVQTAFTGILSADLAEGQELVSVALVSKYTRNASTDKIGHGVEHSIDACGPLGSTRRPLGR